jgi:serine/threonine-protein kinase
MKRSDGSSDPTVTPSEVVSDSSTLGDTAVDPRTSSSDLRGRIAIQPTSYEVGELLGRGGMGEVLLARDPRIGRNVAIKRMRGTDANADAVARFLREAKIQALLDHPAIVPVYELGQDAQGLPYFTMKRLAGVTLHDRIGDPEVGLQVMLRAFVDVCLAIELAHTHGIVHRDLKPSNVMTGDFGEVYVLDWGLARLIGDPQNTAPIAKMELASLDGQTEAGALLGTPGYMSPEQVRGELVGPATDVYALGAILFEILTREPLHPRGTAGLASSLAGQSDTPSKRAPDRAIPPELDAACAIALRETAAERPTARAIADRVQRYLDGDRDLEQRRALAVVELAAAQLARSEGRRADAIRAAGRAMALDPASEAAELVTSLLVEPPRELPPELAAELEADELRIGRDRSRRSIGPYLTALLILPLLPFLEISNWPLLIMVVGGALGMATLAWWNSRGGHDHASVLMVANLCLFVVATRINGPFGFMPMVLAFMLLAMGAHRDVAMRPLWVIGWTIFASLLPFVLEGLGVFASTWHMGPDGLTSWGTIVASRTTLVAVAIIGVNLTLAIVIGLFSISSTRARRDAQHHLHVQAWQLRQLLPQRSPGR